MARNKSNKTELTSKKSKKPLCKHTEDALDQYFTTLNGDRPGELYDLVIGEVQLHSWLAGYKKAVHGPVHCLGLDCCAILAARVPQLMVIFLGISMKLLYSLRSHVVLSLSTTNPR